MNSLKNLTLCCQEATQLPSALTGLALRVSQFTVEDDRAGSSGGWVINILGITPLKVEELLAVLPPYMVNVLYVENAIEVCPPGDSANQQGNQ